MQANLAAIGGESYAVEIWCSTDHRFQAKEGSIELGFWTLSQAECGMLNRVTAMKSTSCHCLASSNGGRWQNPKVFLKEAASLSKADDKCKCAEQRKPPLTSGSSSLAKSS